MVSTDRVNELVTEITLDLWAKFQEYKPKHKRADEMITYLVRELAFEKVKNEILKSR